ncbi:uncharacterized protein MONBRDRAFT_8087 [Monosiga brevicollis MX1]|uniref:RPA-interacting protein C-terminal domain-containing protein n=1 Tax=Monosiga brevicollis TaxID=81824 RepID=A9UZ06_MONBE|nr:uncharacterized protein MONBRDRAFT_8087 [Monosiga brevicollis MX1]EDQ89701.1 predicted protein [Monosiga brevicollis MX1]|eukprot:XP_001745730.1 hypothetical protein [Monosiga brevicollis MX1]
MAANAKPLSLQIADARGISYKGKPLMWKERFKARCREELRRKRYAAMDQRRLGSGHDGTTAEEGTMDMETDVEQVMREQLALLQQQVVGDDVHALSPGVDAAQAWSTEPGALCSRSQPFSLGSHPRGDARETHASAHDFNSDEGQEDVDILTPSTEAEYDYLLDLWSEIQQELMVEDASQAFLEDEAQIEEAEQEEARARDEALAALSLADDNAVTCPVCRHSLLRMRLCVIFCPCGFQLNTQDEGMTLAQFGHLLYDLVDEHDATGCSQRLSFRVCETMAERRCPQVLEAACRACGFMNFV